MSSKTSAFSSPNGENRLYKTKMCFKYLTGCTNKSCSFAHSKDEIKMVECVYGSECSRTGCSFHHPGEKMPSQDELFRRASDNVKFMVPESPSSSSSAPATKIIIMLGEEEDDEEEDDDKEIGDIPNRISKLEIDNDAINNLRSKSDNHLRATSEPISTPRFNTPRFSSNTPQEFSYPNVEMDTEDTTEDTDENKENNEDEDEDENVTEIDQDKINRDQQSMYQSYQMSIYHAQQYSAHFIQQAQLAAQIQSSMFPLNISLPAPAISPNTPSGSSYTSPQSTNRTYKSKTQSPQSFNSRSETPGPVTRIQFEITVTNDQMVACMRAIRNLGITPTIVSLQ